MVTYMIFYIIPANPARLACGQRATETCIANASHPLGVDRAVAGRCGEFLAWRGGGAVRDVPEAARGRPPARDVVHEPSRRDADDPRRCPRDGIARLRRRD